MLPKALIVNFWQVVYADRAREDRAARMAPTLAKLLAKAGIEAAPAALAQICTRLVTPPTVAATTCPPLVQRVMEVSRTAGLPIPSQVAAAFARKASQTAVNFAPPNQFPEAFKQLKKLAEHYALVLVGNATVPTGAGLREVLDGDHLLQFFRATVFSDESGANLPAPALYETALTFLRLEPRDVWVIAGDVTRDLPAAQKLRLQPIFLRRENAAITHTSVSVTLPHSVPEGIETVASLQALAARLKAD